MLASEQLTSAVGGLKVTPLFPFGLLITPETQGQELRGLSPLILKSMMRSAPLVLFRGFAPLEREQLLALCARDPQTELLHWDFGPVMEMQERPNAQNYLFSSEEVPFHWDGAFHRVPSYLVFNCIEAPEADAGGETIFADTSRIWEMASDEERSQWRRTRLVYQTEKKAHYGGRIEVEMVDRHPLTGRTILRYAEPVATKLNPVSLEIQGPLAGTAHAFIETMAKTLRDPRFLYQHRWDEGDLLIADNHQLSHGRNAFRKDSPRHLRRIQIL